MSALAPGNSLGGHYQFNIDGMEYCVGVWILPAFGVPFMCLNKFKNGTWQTLVMSSELTEEWINQDGFKQIVDHYLVGFNNRLQHEHPDGPTEPVPPSLFEQLGDYIAANVRLDSSGTRLENTDT